MASPIRAVLMHLDATHCVFSSQVNAWRGADGDGEMSTQEMLSLEKRLRGSETVACLSMLCSLLPC